LRYENVRVLARRPRVLSKWMKRTLVSQIECPFVLLSPANLFLFSTHTARTESMRMHQSEEAMTLHSMRHPLNAAPICGKSDLASWED